MFNAIVRFSIRRKMFVALATLILLIGGVCAMLTLPVDAVPDITNNQVQVVTVSPTLAPQEVEQLITIPVETSEQYYERDGDTLCVTLRTVARHGGVQRECANAGGEAACERADTGGGGGDTARAGRARDDAYNNGTG